MVRLSGVPSVPAVIAWVPTLSQLVTYVSGEPAAVELPLRAATPPRAATTATSARRMKLRLRCMRFSLLRLLEDNTVDRAVSGSPARLGNLHSSTPDCWKPGPGWWTIGALVATWDSHVVGREDEIAVLREFVSAVPHGARALCIRGEAGIGKTTLWRAAI